MRNPGTGRLPGRRIAAGLAAVTLSAGLGGLISGCTAHQEAASPTEQPEAGARQSAGGGGSAAAPLPLPQPQPAAPLVRPGTGLDAQDKDRLTEAQRMGAQWVVMVVQTAPGGTDQARTALTSLGGIVGTTSPAPGFLSVTMPAADAERAASAPGVTAADVTEVVPPNQPRTNGNR